MKKIAIPLLFFIMLFYFVYRFGFRTREPSDEIVWTQDTTEAVDPNKIQVRHQLIEGFPNFPVYPLAVLEKSLKMTQAIESQGYQASWEVQHPKGVPGIAAWYIRELPVHGWEIIHYPADPQELEQMIHAKKGNSHVSVTIEPGTAPGTNAINRLEFVEILVDFPLTYEE